MTPLINVFEFTVRESPKQSAFQFYALFIVDIERPVAPQVIEILDEIHFDYIDSQAVDDPYLVWHKLMCQIELPKDTELTDFQYDLPFVFNDETPFALWQMLESEAWQMYEESILGNDLFIDDPERAERNHEAVAYGGNGSTHLEVIDDQREFIRTLDNPIVEEILNQELDAVEEWHLRNGSLEEVIG